MDELKKLDSKPCVKSNLRYLHLRVCFDILKRGSCVLKMTSVSFSFLMRYLHGFRYINTQRILWGEVDWLLQHHTSSVEKELSSRKDALMKNMANQDLSVFKDWAIMSLWEESSGRLYEATGTAVQHILPIMHPCGEFTRTGTTGIYCYTFIQSTRFKSFAIQNIISMLSDIFTSNSPRQHH